MILEQLNTIEATAERESYLYKITHYLLENSDSLIEYKVNRILKDLDISKSTLRRYVLELGYKNFTAIQYQIYYEMNSGFRYRPKGIQEDIWKGIERKRRIIVFGDEHSLSPLLIYRHLFKNTIVPIDFCFHQNHPVSLLSEMDVSDEDIVFFVSLYYSNLDFELGFFDEYMTFMNVLNERHISHLYIGKVARKKELENHFIEINEQSIADRIYHLCQIFENIYAYLDKIQRSSY